jgi:hypothetical protein
VQRDNTALAAKLVQSADDAALTDPDAARLLACPPELADLSPWPDGIRRGATVAAVGSTSLLMALMAPAMAAGSGAAVVGMPHFGVLAAGVDYRLPLEHLALVPAPGPDWATVVGALIDGIDLVVVGTPAGGVPEATARALMTRARQRGSVLLTTTAWPNCDVAIEGFRGQSLGLTPPRSLLDPVSPGKPCDGGA